MTKQRVLYPSVETPAVIVDLDKLEANIREMSQVAAEAGIRLRPHTKVHESVEIAKMQIEAGACGIEVGPIGQAEAMAEEGIDDILIAHPGFYGYHKLETLKKLLNIPGLKITVVIDMFEQAEGVSQAGHEAGKKVPVVIKVDTNTGANGIARYGVLPGKPTLELAKKLRKLQGVQFIGIYAHEMGGTEGPEKMAFESASQVAETARMLKREGFKIEHVSMGASFTFRYTCHYIKEGKFPEITEIHPGSCVLGDISYVKMGGNKSIETCAASVLTTVMSTSHPDWFVIDAGYKTFGAAEVKSLNTWGGMTSRGFVKDRPDLWVGFAFAETTKIYYTEPRQGKLSIGERLEIVPNSILIVVNTKDQLYGVRNNKVERIIRITGRGRGV